MRRRSLWLLVPAFAAAALAIGAMRPEPVQQPPARAGRAEKPIDEAGPVQVVDGDTLRLGAQRIRLYGIDAPEHAQSCEDAGGRRYRCGDAAAAALTRLIGGGRPDCAERDRDRYGRSVAICRIGGRDLNRAMVAEGWAVAYSHYSRVYEPDEAAARQARRGLWQGSFERPDLYRAERRHRG